MRIAAMVLGILGGLIGAYLVTFSPWEVPAWILLTWILLLPVAAIAGGVLALRRPAVGGILMLVSGIAGVIAAHLYWLHPGYWLGYIFAGFLLIMGGAIALAAREKRPAARVAVMALGILGGLFGAYGAYIAMPWVPLLSAAIVFLFSLIAIAGGVLALRRPAVGGILMLIPWIGFFLVAPFGLFREMEGALYSLACIIASLLLLAGAILALADYQSRSIARIVALVLGISAGVIGALGVYGGVPVVPGGFLALGALLSTMGIAGAVLTRGRPGVAGTLMLVSGIGGFAAALIVRVFAVELSVVHYLYTTATVTGEAIIFCMAYAIAGFPMIAGAILALAAREKWPQERLSS